MEQEQQAIVVVLLLVRIIAAIICGSRASELNRGVVGWAFFGFFLPLIALIAVFCSKKKTDWYNDEAV